MRLTEKMEGSAVRTCLLFCTVSGFLLTVTCWFNARGKQVGTEAWPWSISVCVLTMPVGQPVSGCSRVVDAF